MNSFSALSEIFEKELSVFETIGILGFGREGKSTFAALQKYLPGKKIIIADRNESVFNDIRSLQGPVLRFLSGDEYLDILNFADIVFVSPGISLIGRSYPENLIITSQTDFIFRNFGEKIIAITGTKGKSTTAALTAHILKQHYDMVPLAGNIGIPPFDVLEDLYVSEVAVFEVSSHQLQHISSAPRVAILLNLFPEHLDYYPDTETYFEAKKSIFRFQDEHDCIILNNDEPLVYAAGIDSQGTILHYSLTDHGKPGSFLKNGSLMLRDLNEHGITGADDLQLKGIHNLSNCLAVVCACSFLKFPVELISAGLKTFPGLPHRMERVMSGDGRVFYNDSIATIPEATLAAMVALKPVSTLILGGMDRGLPYDEFLEKLLQSELKTLVFYGDAGKRMFEIFSRFSTEILAEYFYDFSECVAFAAEHTLNDEICLLSPAASSYDQFKNFEERGEKFKKLIAQL